jgi:hypothetical protein
MPEARELRVIWRALQVPPVSHAQELPTDTAIDGVFAAGATLNSSLASAAFRRLLRFFRAAEKA